MTPIKRVFMMAIVLILTLICCGMSEVVAATYFVSPDGTNTWPNCTSSDNPCRARGTEKTFLGAGAGDTVYFLSGTYNPGNAPSWAIPAWNPSNSGSSGSPITFKCYSGTCTITANDVGPSIGSSKRDWIVWDGFTGRKSDLHNDFARFDEANYCSLFNCDFTGSSVMGSINVPVFIQRTNYFTMRNCRLHGSLGPHTTNSAGFMSYYATNSLIENNEFYNNHTGIFDKVDSSYCTYRYNYFHDNDTKGFLLQTESASGNPDHIYIYQNIFRSHVYDAIDIGGGLKKSYVYVYNNTIYNTSNYGIISQGAGTDVLEIFNNVVHTTRGCFIRINGSDSNVYSDYNDFYDGSKWQFDSTNYTTISSWRTAKGFDTKSVTTNPNFVNAGGKSVTDYKRTSYPTTGRGGSYPNVMGAYITGSEIIGVNIESSPPTTPTGLRVVP